MSEQELDPFAVDMELLRRLGVVRTALDGSEGSGSRAEADILATVRAARAYAGRSASPVAPLLEELERVLALRPEGAAPPWESGAASVEDALSAAQEAVLAPGEPEAQRLLSDALARLRREAGAAGAGPWSPPPLDEAAAFVVEMDPGSAADAKGLAKRLDAALAPAAGAVAERLREAASALAPVLGAKVRKTARRDAVARVADLLEEAALLAEAEEAAAPVAPAAPAAPPAAAATSAAPATTAESIPDADPLPAAADAELVGDFVTESFEYLEQAEEALLALEANPADAEAVNVVFRAFHTVKGVSGFLELRRISEFSHHAESLLSRVRDGGLVYTGAVADLALRSVDVLKALLDAVRGALESGTIAVPPSYAPLFGILSDPTLAERLRSGDRPRTPGSSGAREPEEGGDAAEAERSSAGGTENSIRIRTDRLDRLVDMVGELVIAHSMLAQDGVVLRDRGTLSRKVDHTAKLLRELQDLSTSLRMVPLKPAIRKVSRVVRDLSRKSGKQVRLVTEGEDTEIDRSMVDVLADPLVHMVRNSVDHGLEPGDERVAAGKPREGTVRIAAYQAGGNVVIEVSDDGRGLDRARIVAKAREKGLIDSDRGMSDREIYALIFAAGFSTAEKVTEVSGRGVGMDVVRRNVESLRGRVTIDSTPGRGSTFSIILPLTLAITDGMVIRIGEQRFIIPSVKILMSLRPEAAAISTVAGKGEMVLLHGELLPVVRLHRHWGIRAAVQDPTKGLLVIVGEGSRKAALLVDELVTQQQFVVKPLTGMVANTRGVAGGAVLGNGDVGLILDPDALVTLLLSGGAAAA